MNHKAFERFLNSLPQDVVDSFNYHQLKALSAALEEEIKSSHPVNIRVTIPFWLGHFYLVILLGRERRSWSRRQTDSQKYSLYTIANVLAVMVFLMTGALISLGLWQLKLTAKDVFLPEQVEQAYPTVVPFKGTESDCLESGRSWENGQCIDYAHDRNF